MGAPDIAWRTAKDWVGTQEIVYVFKALCGPAKLLMDMHGCCMAAHEMHGVAKDVCGVQESVQRCAKHCQA